MPRVNPHFPVNSTQARARAVHLRSEVKPLPRPVLILGGWRAPHVSVWSLQRLLEPMTSGKSADFLAISYPLCGCVRDAADVAMRRIARRWPGVARGEQDVDVIGFSMGGLVARLLASKPTGDYPALRMARLFTLATPHRGAELARAFRPDRAARAMKPGSEFLTSLDAQLGEAQYELVCYAHLNDWWVGSRRTAPPGREPIWVDTRNPVDAILSHFTVSSDMRVIVDLALRLRGEQPIAMQGSAPP